jgi:hypothetical protein
MLFAGFKDEDQSISWHRSLHGTAQVVGTPYALARLQHTAWDLGNFVPDLPGTNHELHQIAEWSADLHRVPWYPR